MKSFDAALEKRDVAPAKRSDLKKWLRYFLDFRAKYPAPETRSEQVRLFIEKLRQKKQSRDQEKQAYASFPRRRESSFFNMLRSTWIPACAGMTALPTECFSL
ncbi:MAG: hypothetical protein AB1306_03985 [Nitrospirota bacterium]